VTDVTIADMNPSPGAQLTDLLETLTAGGTPYKLTIQQILTLYHGSYLQIVNNLSDLANNLTALNNLQLPNGAQVITTNANIALVNSGGNNTTTFNIAGVVYINNNAASGVTINAKLSAVNSTTPGQKSIAVGQSIVIVNLSINPDTETHPIEVQDDAAAGLETIQTNQLVVCTLIDNSTAAGVWGTYVIGNAAWYNVTDSDSLNYPKIPTMKTGTKTTDNLVTISNNKGSVQDSGFPVSSLITQDTLTTTNASFNAISNISIAENTGKKIIAKVIGKKVGAVSSAWATLDITISRTSGGDITLIGTPTFDKGQSSTEDVQYTIDTGLDALIIEVKGVSTDTYKWSCQYSTQLISD